MKETVTAIAVKRIEILGAATHALHIVWSHASSPYAKKKVHETLTRKSLGVVKPLVCLKSTQPF